MAIFHHFDPTAPVTRYSDGIRFRSVHPEVDFAARANRKASAAKAPANGSKILKNGDATCPNEATVPREEDAFLEQQESTSDHEILGTSSI